MPAGDVFSVRAVRPPTTLSREGMPAGAENVDFDLPALGTLRLRFLDAASGEPVRIQRQPVYGLFWRAADAQAFEDEQPSPDLDGRQDLLVEAGRVDVLVHLVDDGYAQRLVEGIQVPAGGASEVVTLELERALEARLVFAGEGAEPEDLRGHLLFLVREEEQGSIEGPFAEQGPGVNHRINGIWMRLERPTLLTQMLEVGADGHALVPGLSPGRYHLRAYPDDFAFEPEAFDLPATGEEPIPVRWKRR